jgi:hypothetical protein
MSTVTTSLPLWMPADRMRDLGFTPAGPETDYGMQWGENRAVRVSYAPHADRDDGFVYAYDGKSERYLVLAPHTTPEAVQAAWRLTDCTSAPDAYVALAALGEQPVALEQARALLLHCVDRELAAYRDFTATGLDGPVRVDAAHAVVVQRSARVSAEEILVDSAKAANPDVAPILIRYRITDDNGWIGRVAGVDLDSALADLRCVDELARQHDLTALATSVNRGHTRVAAARVPELNVLATHAPLTADAPQLGL